MPAKLSDESITKMVLDGDINAFEILVQKYQSAVLGYAYHLVGNFNDAEDLTQEAFLQAFLSLHQLNDSGKFASWLKQITANICKMWLRQQKREFVSIEQISDSELNNASSLNTQKQLEDMEIHESIQQSYQSLSDESRLVVTLRYIDGLTYNEIGKFLDLPISTVKWRLHDAKRRLKKEMVEMIEKELKQQGEKFQKKMLLKVRDEQMQIFKQIFDRILSNDKGHLYLTKRRINQPGGAQWVKVIWDDFVIPELAMITNQQYWRIATEEDDADIKSEMGKWEDWKAGSYIYIRKKMDGGTPSDSVNVYGYNPTKAGSPIDENDNLKIRHKPINIDQKLLDNLKENGFDKIERKDVLSFRIERNWDGDYFQKVIQHRFRDRDKRDIYLEIAIPSSDETFIKFPLKRYITGMLTSIESNPENIIVFYSYIEENSVISAMWPHWGQFLSIYIPLGFPLYPYKDQDNFEKQQQILEMTKSLGSFFNIFADYLGYSESVAKKPTYRLIRWKEVKDQWNRYGELHPETNDIYRKREEPYWTVAFRGITKAFYEAKNNKRPTAPPQNASIDDIKIDMSEIGLREHSREKKDKTMVGTLSMELPEESIQLEYRGVKGKKVIIDFMKFSTDIEAGEFCWQTKDQYHHFANNDDRTPYYAFRSSNPIDKHVNALWAEGIWAIHIRIPITKPSTKKTEQNPIPEEELREAIFKSLLKHFAINH